MLRGLCLTGGCELLKELPGLRGAPVGNESPQLQVLENVPELALEVVEERGVVRARLEA